MHTVINRTQMWVPLKKRDNVFLTLSLLTLKLMFGVNWTVPAIWFHWLPHIVFLAWDVTQSPTNGQCLSINSPQNTCTHTHTLTQNHSAYQHLEDGVFHTRAKHFSAVMSTHHHIQLTHFHCNKSQKHLLMLYSEKKGKCLKWSKQMPQDKLQIISNNWLWLSRLGEHVK